MTLERAIEILEAYKRFLSREINDSPSLFELEEAIDIVAKFYKDFGSEFEEKLGFTQ